MAVPIESMFNFSPNRCSNIRHTFMCSKESHEGVFAMDDSGPISVSGTSSAAATSLIAALILLSVINLFSVDDAAIRVVGNRYESVSVVKVGRYLIFASGNIFPDYPAMTVKPA